MNRSWWVYILRCADGTLYTGISVDVAARVQTHNKGRGAKYTRSRRPVTLLWSRVTPPHLAYKIERKIKRLRRAEKERLATGDEGFWQEIQVV